MFRWGRGTEEQTAEVLELGDPSGQGPLGPAALRLCLTVSPGLPAWELESWVGPDRITHQPGSAGARLAPTDALGQEHML